MNDKAERLNRPGQQPAIDEQTAGPRHLARRLPRLSNGRRGKLREVPARFSPDWLEKMDQRYAAVRTLRERFHSLVADYGGLEELGRAQQTLARRAVWLESMAESMEAQMMAGDPVDSNKYANVINSLTNCLRTLGVKPPKQSRAAGPRDGSVRPISAIGRPAAGGPPAKRGR